MQSDLLSVNDVLARYGLRDRRAARRLMDVAGAFRVGRRVYVTREDLLAAERAGRLAAGHSVPSARPGSGGSPVAAKPGRCPHVMSRAASRELPVDWREW